MPREHNKQETRDGIIDAAERLLGRYGYAKMTMTDLAEEAGIGVGTTYLYFPGKVDVALAVLERLNAQVRARLTEIAHSDGSAADKLNRMLTARVMLRYEAARTRRHRIDEFKRAVQSVLAERRVCWQQAETEIFASVLSEGRRIDEFYVDEPLSVAETLMRATSCLTPGGLTPQDLEDPAEMARRTEQLVTLLVRGLQKDVPV